MPGKGTDGFTKAANKTKFVRNRDIKLKDSEKAKEEKIKKGMSEGVCTKCREKAQWRFKFDKYKPLKAPGTCGCCHNKTVYKAYRTLCDPCATTKKVCPSCCKDHAETIREEQANTAATQAMVYDKAGEMGGRDDGEEMCEEEDDDEEEEHDEGSKAVGGNDSIDGLKGSNIVFATSSWGVAGGGASKTFAVNLAKYRKDRVVGEEV